VDATVAGGASGQLKGCGARDSESLLHAVANISVTNREQTKMKPNKLLSYAAFQNDDAKTILYAYLTNRINDMEFDLKPCNAAVMNVAHKAVDEFNGNKTVNVPEVDAVVKQDAQIALEENPNQVSIWSKTQCKVRIPVFPDEA